MEKCGKWLETAGENTVKLLVIAVEAGLLLLSICSTSILYGYEEHTEYLWDNILVHLGTLIAIFLFLLILARNYKFGTGFSKHIRKVTIGLFLVVTALGIYWITNTQFISLGDSSIVSTLAENMQNGDYSAFMNQGYGEKYANQIGIILLVKVIGSFAGFGSNIILQYINIFALLVIYYCLARTAAELFGEMQGFATLVLAVCFLPLGLYIVFAYSNMLSWAAACFAIYQEIMLLKTRKRRYGILMAVSISAAIVLKLFAIIVLIAMAIYAVYEGSRKKSYAVMGYIAGAMLFTVVVNACMGAYIDGKLEGYERKPMTFWGHVAMGMQEGYMAPGWYNGIHDYTYWEYEGDREKTTKVFKDMIKESLDTFVEDPGYAVSFYGRKVASAWNNPTFQGFWFGEIETPLVEVPEWITSVYQGELRGILDVYLNYLLTVIHAGALCYFLLGWKRIRLKHLLPAIAFLGGFLFLLIWETKCQYTIGFFILLLPYCAAGMVKVLSRLSIK